MSDGAVCADVYTQREWHTGPGVHRPTLTLLGTRLIRSRVCMGLSFPGVGWGWRLGTGQSAQPQQRGRGQVPGTQESAHPQICTWRLSSESRAGPPRVALLFELLPSYPSDGSAPTHPSTPSEHLANLPPVREPAREQTATSSPHRALKTLQSHQKR